jgi:hypothetical protein
MFSTYFNGILIEKLERRDTPNATQRRSSFLSTLFGRSPGELDVFTGACLEWSGVVDDGEGSVFGVVIDLQCAVGLGSRSWLLADAYPRNLVIALLCLLCTGTV